MQTTMGISAAYNERMAAPKCVPAADVEDGGGGGSSPISTGTVNCCSQLEGIRRLFAAPNCVNPWLEDRIRLAYWSNHADSREMENALLIRTLPPLPDGLIARRRGERLFEEGGHKIPRSGVLVASIHYASLSSAHKVLSRYVPTIRAGPVPGALFRSVYAPCSTSLQKGSVALSSTSLDSGRMRGSSFSALYSNVCALFFSSLRPSVLVGCFVDVDAEVPEVCGEAEVDACLLSR